MSRIPSITLTLPQDGDIKKVYNTWKRRREELVKTLGHYLLLCTEAELIECYEKWEATIKSLETVEKEINYLLALLYISILHYFKRSSDQIKIHVPFITKMLEFKLRSVVMASCQTLYWLVKDTADCIGFLRDEVTLVSRWMTTNSRFAALHILKVAGKFILPSVFEETTNNFHVLWSSVTSNDVELRYVAAKDIKLHLKGLKNSSQAAGDFTDQLFNDCMKILKENQIKENAHGVILVLNYLFKLYPQSVDLIPILEYMPIFVSKTSKSEILVQAWFDLLLQIAKKAIYAFTPDNTPKLFQSLMTATRMFYYSPNLLKMFQRFIRVFHAHNVVQPSCIVEFLQTVAKAKKIQPYNGIVFDTLSLIIDEEPTVPISPSFFLDSEPSTQYVRALRKRMSLFNDLSTTLKNKLHDGFQTRATIDQQIISLTIFKEFWNQITDNKNTFYDKISPLARSSNTDVRLLVASILPIFDTKSAFDDLMFLALFDNSKQVRAVAISELEQPERLAHASMLPQILTDPSYKVRRNAIKLISSVAPLNPMLFHVPITSFVQQTMLSILSSSNPCICQRISSLLPLIAQHLLQFCPAYIGQIAKICYTFLENPEKDTNSKLHSVIQRDVSHDSNAIVENATPFDTQCPNKLRLFQIENKYFFEKMAANLFETLKCLAEHLDPYLNEIIPIFITAFETPHTELVYTAALSALIEITNKLEAAVTIPSEHPDISIMLMRLLRNSKSEQVSILVLKLLGTFGITSYPHNIGKNIEDSPELDFKSPSFYIDYVLNALVKLLDEPNISVFESITSIFVKESRQACRFLGKIIPAFSRALATMNPVDIFSQLEVIAYYCGIRMEPFAQTLAMMILQNMNIPSALKLASVLSFFLKTEFIPFVPPLFHNAVHILSSHEGRIMQELVDFVTYSVVFQNQPLEIYIAAVESRLSTMPPADDIVKLISSLITIVQLSDATYECARIARLCIPLLRQPLRPVVMQLLYSLAVYCHMSHEFLHYLAPDESTGFSMLKDFLEGKSESTENFLTRVTITMTIQTPSYVPLVVPDGQRVFELSVRQPQFHNTAKWLEDLSFAVINNSPQLAIRACQTPAAQSPAFRDEIFPIAFLSCWHATKPAIQKQFSEIIASIFKEQSQPNPIFLTLAELLVQAGQEFQISRYTIACACQRPVQGLRFLVKYYQDKPTSEKAIEKMLELNTKLGRIQSSRGILKVVSLPSIGKWSETLGEWDAALEVYKKETSPNIGALLRCYARLERWSEIRQLVPQFQMMTPEEKHENALWYAWAFYKNDDLQNVNYYISQLPQDGDLNKILFRQLYLVKSGRYDDALESIRNAMSLLVKDTSIYTSLNANQADTNLMFANHFVELEEAIKAKRNMKEVVPEIWRRRLNNVTGDGYSWMRLVEIRNLVVDPAENKRSQLKLLSVLVKERKWTLVDAFQPMVMNKLDNADVQVAFMKLLWSRGHSAEAIDSARLLNLIHNEYPIEKFEEKFATVQPQVLKDVASKITAFKAQFGDSLISAQEMYNFARDYRNNFPLTNDQRARLLRLEATWRSQSPEPAQSVEAVELFRESAVLSPSVSLTWANWAYASIKAATLQGEMSDVYVQMAIDGFLKALQLQTTTTNLEYLCQLFSLFFRHGATSKMPDDLYDRISNMEPEIVEQILPQVVCQISYPNKRVKETVHTLLTNFGIKHFQAIVFQLRLLKLSNETEKAQIAADILQKVSAADTELAKEAEIFSDGMIRAAVTWYEIWLERIEQAYVLEQSDEREQALEKLYQLLISKNTAFSEMDKQFVRLFDRQITNMITDFNKIQEQKPRKEITVQSLWSQVRQMFRAIRDKFNQIGVMQLEMVSQELYEKRNFKLSVPGTYHTNDSGPHIVVIDPTMQIINTATHPRIMNIAGSDGGTWKFLLKGHEDLRLDQRIMQFFDLINSLLRTTKATAKCGATIIKYPIIPLATNAGLISWVVGADTLHTLVTDFRKSNGINKSAENIIWDSLVGSNMSTLSNLQKLELWPEVTRDHPANELRDTFWVKARDSVSWVRCVDMFAQSTALMSMAGYIIGLGDRHPSNIMIQRHTGHVIHIDFGDSFEVTFNRVKMPEKVPFRLTRMIVNALGVAGCEGSFKYLCEDILYMLRKNKSSVLAQLEIFVHEPIFAGKDVDCGDPAIMRRISAKLNGTDPLEFDEEVRELSVEEQADRLIRIASDYRRYCTHYEGWCQYW